MLQVKYKQLLIYFPRQYRLPTISDQKCWTQAMKTTNSTYLHENRSQIPHKCTPPTGPSLSENFFVVVCVDLQLADGVEGFFLPGQLSPLGVHGDGVLQGGDVPHEGVHGVHGVAAAPVLQGPEGRRVVRVGDKLTQDHRASVVPQL